MSLTANTSYPRLILDSSYLPAPSASSSVTVGGVRLSALIETGIYLALVCLFSYVFGDGSRYSGQPLHPFWIIVLMVTVQYGAREGLAAAVLAGLFLLLGNMPEQSITEGTYDYVLRVAYLPFLWIAAALALGMIRARQIAEKKSLIDRTAKAEDAAADIAAGYKILSDAKDQLELRLSEERCSLMTVYNIAKSLETFDPAQAMDGIEKLVRSTLNPAKFSIFRTCDNGLRLDLAYGWEKGDQFQAQFKDDSDLYAGIVGKKRILSVAWENEEKALDHQGLMAGPIVDETTGRVFGMLKIEDAGFMELGIRTHETLQIVCSWIARVFGNIEKHQQALNERFDQDDEPTTDSTMPAGVLIKKMHKSKNRPLVRRAV